MTQCVSPSSQRAKVLVSCQLSSSSSARILFSFVFNICLWCRRLKSWKGAVTIVTVRPQIAQTAARRVRIWAFSHFLWIGKCAIHFFVIVCNFRTIIIGSNRRSDMVRYSNIFPPSAILGVCLLHQSCVVLAIASVYKTISSDRRSIGHKWFPIRLILTPSSYLSPFSKYLTCNFYGLELGLFKVKGHGDNRKPIGGFLSDFNCV